MVNDPDLSAELDAAEDIVMGRAESPATARRCQNALTWIRHVAALHYLGGAFDPEHMRDLANMATAALQGKDFPDYAESMAKGQEKAAEWAALFATLADDHDDDEVPG
jgi:hypothetical protein